MVLIDFWFILKDYKSSFYLNNLVYGRFFAIMFIFPYNPNKNKI